MAHHSTLEGQIERYGIEEGTARYERMVERKRELAKTRNTLAGFISRYGEDEGRLRYDTFKSKSSMSKESFISRYGETDGVFRYEEAKRKRNAKNSRCLKYWLDMGLTEAEAKDIVKTIQKNFNSLEKFIEKYGDDGYKKYRERYETHAYNLTIDGFIQRYGQEDGEKRYKKYCLDRSTSLEKYIERYGEVEGWLLYNDRNQRTAHTLQNYIKWYGEDEGVSRFQSKWKGSSIGRASTASLKVFSPVVEWLIENNIAKPTEIFLGTDDSSEYFLRDADVIYWYDLTIPKYKIIVEYNGVHIHPKPDMSEPEKWSQAYTGKSFAEVLAYDTRKKETAIKNGFSYLCVWSDDPIKTNIEKIIEFISEKVK